GDAVKRADSVAALIGLGATVYDLADFEHCYQPLYSTAKDVVHMAALVAGNILSGRMRQVHMGELRGLVESGAYILDVREENEFALSHIKGAHNIPTTALRRRLDEIPRDIPVYLHCRTSQRSYYAYCCLRDNGFDNIYNISGSYLGFSIYEYFNDMTTGRTSILTDYNFN
ncbi:MAG: pyridine nucleotide-disulfide oxidoreductase, partial [Firmicutes bacterium]|nr:pyridine nucleotide-disulfide oxidoreductase [Bacillota bacterium]